MKLNILWLLAALTDLQGCILSLIVLRQKTGQKSKANRYLYWFFIGQALESFVASLSVLILVLYPSTHIPATEWFAWLRVGGRGVKAFYVWRFALYLLNLLAPEHAGVNGRTSKDVADAITPNSGSNAEAGNRKTLEN